MNAKAFVDSLFEGYEETAALADFKDELLSNLNAKIESFVRKGMDAEAAFAKASAELGDVSVLANELSLKKRREVFEEVYMDIKQYMPPKRVITYIVFGIVMLFGIIVGLIVLFSYKWLNSSIDPSGAFATMIPFLTAAIVGFTWLGTTQETASAYPVSKKRAVWYAVAAGLITFGIFIALVVLFGSYLKNDNLELVGAISTLIPFVLPGIGILTYLVLTEKDRLKPWAKSFRNKTVEQEMAMWNDPATATRFGMFSGAIWIFAIGLFILLGFLIGFKFSWLVFIFAVAVQLLVQGLMSKRGN